MQTTKSYDLKEEAEKLVYKTEKGELYVPAQAIFYKTSLPKNLKGVKMNLENLINILLVF